MRQTAQERKAQVRKQRLAASGHVYNDLRRLANVSYSMVYKWMNAERESAKLERAFATLTNGQAIAS